jgi:hypothetical protein
MLTQHLLAIAAMNLWQYRFIHFSSRSNWSWLSDLNSTFRREGLEFTYRGGEADFDKHKLKNES